MPSVEDIVKEMIAAGRLAGSSTPMAPPSSSTAASSAFDVMAAAAGQRAAGTASSSKVNSRKRKPETSLEEDIAAYKQDLSHIETDGMLMDQNCNQVRRRINQVLDSGIFKKGEFCNAIGSSSNALNRFLAQSGPNAGMQSEAYENAWAWFEQREPPG